MEETTTKQPSRRWTTAENRRFVLGLKKFGRHWKRVAEVVGSRTPGQVRSHAQKYEKKLLQTSRHFHVKCTTKVDSSTQYGEGIIFPSFRF